MGEPRLPCGQTREEFEQNRSALYDYTCAHGTTVENLGYTFA